MPKVQGLEPLQSEMIVTGRQTPLLPKQWTPVSSRRLSPGVLTGKEVS